MMFGEWTMLGRHIDAIRNLLESEPPDKIARRTWRAIFLVENELVVATLQQVVRLVSSMDAYESKITVTVTRNFTTTPHAVTHLQRPGSVGLEPEDIAIYLHLDRVSAMLNWRDVTQYPDLDSKKMLAGVDGAKILGAE